MPLLQIVSVMHVGSVLPSGIVSIAGAVAVVAAVLVSAVSGQTTALAAFDASVCANFCTGNCSTKLCVLIIYVMCP